VRRGCETPTHLLKPSAGTAMLSAAGSPSRSYVGSSASPHSPPSPRARVQSAHHTRTTSPPAPHSPPRLHMRLVSPHEPLLAVKPPPLNRDPSGGASSRPGSSRVGHQPHIVAAYGHHQPPIVAAARRPHRTICATAPRPRRCRRHPLLRRPTRRAPRRGPPASPSLSATWRA
jgi:hypothetical protein